MKIKIYTKAGCPSCARAKDVLDLLGHEYETVALDDREERRAFYAECGPGVRTLPQIFVDGDRLGGYDDLVLKGLPE